MAANIVTATKEIASESTKCEGDMGRFIMGMLSIIMRFVHASRQEKETYVRFEVFTAVTMKNYVFWDIRTQFVLHRRHITSPLQSSAS
jgi:hypothetical protein